MKVQEREKEINVKKILCSSDFISIWCISLSLIIPSPPIFIACFPSFPYLICRIPSISFLAVNLLSCLFLFFLPPFALFYLYSFLISCLITIRSVLLFFISYYLYSLALSFLYFFRFSFVHFSYPLFLSQVSLPLFPALLSSYHNIPSHSCFSSYLSSYMFIISLPVSFFCFLSSLFFSALFFFHLLPFSSDSFPFTRILLSLFFRFPFLSSLFFRVPFQCPCDSGVGVFRVSLCFLRYGSCSLR